MHSAASDLTSCLQGLGFGSAPRGASDSRAGALKPISFTPAGAALPARESKRSRHRPERSKRSRRDRSPERHKRRSSPDRGKGSGRRSRSRTRSADARRKRRSHSRSPKHQYVRQARSSRSPGRHKASHGPPQPEDFAALIPGYARWVLAQWAGMPASLLLLLTALCVLPAA